MTPMLSIAPLPPRVPVPVRFGLRDCLAHLAAWPERLRVWIDQHKPAPPGPAPGRLSPVEPASESAAPSGYHQSVMAEEVAHFLAPGPNKLYLDGTLGGGGHSERLLRAGASVLGLDQDLDAIDYARQRLSEHEDRVAFIHMNFRDYPSLLREVGLEKELDGILLDLGVSSWQIDTADRGFSFSHDGPLDMRMDGSQGRTAADLLAEEPEEELRRIFREYGEEPLAHRVASAIVRRRAAAPFRTTGDLATFVEEVCGRRSGKHPATRVFQALRIAVNDELGALRAALEELPKWLKAGGRVAIITFHSLEDRMVKHYFTEHSRPLLDRPEWPGPRPNPDCYFRLLVRKGLAPSAEEIAANPRARSARLRIAERLPHHEEAAQKIAQ
jgi:16S rRNA (cytosine1402-N4)-methyltransferase